MDRIRRPVVSMLLSLLCLAAWGQEARVIDTASGPLRVETVVTGLEYPWAMVFLPDGRMLVTERPGRLRVVSSGGELRAAPVAGVPEVFAQGQGGLLDVALDPEFANNRVIYLSFAEPGEGGASTAVARGELDGDALRNVEVIFRQQPKLTDDKHFGSRLAFASDGTLYVTMGERFQFEPAQDLSNHLGTIARIHPDGRVPADNPFVERADALPEIWSYGHRNIQAAAVHPETGALWEIEHGPKGGDELNIAEAGRNYGWPVVSWGVHYSGEPIPDPPTHPEFASPILQWTPVIGPSGMVFYSGERFADWQGDILVGGLVSRGIVRVSQDGRSAKEVERIALDRRIRDVEQGPDGAVYAVTDGAQGAILRLTPAGGG